MAVSWVSVGCRGGVVVGRWGRTEVGRSDSAVGLDIREQLTARVEDRPVAHERRAMSAERLLE